MEWQKKYERVPFVERGRIMSGADCWGLVCLVYAQERGIVLPSYAEAYESTDDRARLAEIVSHESQQGWQAVDRPQPFDVILLKMGGIPSHVGIVIDRQRMIHCQRDIGTAIEKINSIRWRDNVAGFFRWQTPKN